MRRDLRADGAKCLRRLACQLLSVIDNFCNARPEADGCEIDHRPLKLAQAFSAFANADKLLDYNRFVEMVSGRSDGFGEECTIDVSDAAAASSAYMNELNEMMGERECFGDTQDDEGEEDIACDAWFYGEDPTVEKVKVESDPAKIAALKASGEALQAEREKKAFEMAAMLERMKANKKTAA